MRQGDIERTRGVHYYDMGTTDGLAACGYTPTSPSDPLLTYAMSGASCQECRQVINDYIEGLKPGKCPTQCQWRRWTWKKDRGAADECMG